MDTKAFLNSLFPNRSFHSHRRYVLVTSSAANRMETNAFLNSVCPNPSFHSRRHYLCSHLFICKPYGNQIFLGLCISEYFIPFTSQLLVNHVCVCKPYGTNAFPNSVFPNLPFHSHRHYFCVVTFSYAHLMETNAFLQSLFPNGSFRSFRQYVFINRFICKQYETDAFPEFVFSRMLISIRIANTCLSISSCGN